MVVITWRRACRSPRLAKVTSFSANGRSRFAFASVVVIRPCSNSDVARLASISRSCAGDPPRRGPLVGVGMVGLSSEARAIVPGCGPLLRCSPFGVTAFQCGGPGGPAAQRVPAARPGPCRARDGSFSELLGLLVRRVVVRLPVVGAVLGGPVVGVG